MRIGNSEGITVLKKGDATLTSASFPFSSIAVPNGCSWVSLTTDGTELQVITGGGPAGSYLLVTGATYFTFRRTGQPGGIWFDSGTLGPNISGGIPSNTSGVIQLNAEMSVLFQKLPDNSWLLVNVTCGRDGMPGNQGAQGFQGTQGFQGDSGTNGSTGPEGFQGPPGDQGIQGGVGFDGPVGNQGVQGDPGPIGITGLQGPAGHNGTPC